jgi:hypothetical protein
MPSAATLSTYFDRNARLEPVKKLEMMEYIVRNSVVRIMLEPKL